MQATTSEFVKNKYTVEAARANCGLSKTSNVDEWADNAPMEEVLAYASDLEKMIRRCNISRGQAIKINIGLKSRTKQLAEENSGLKAKIVCFLNTDVREIASGCTKYVFNAINNKWHFNKPSPKRNINPSYERESPRSIQGDAYENR